MCLIDLLCFNSNSVVNVCLNLLWFASSTDFVPISQRSLVLCLNLFLILVHWVLIAFLLVQICLCPHILKLLLVDVFHRILILLLSPMHLSTPWVLQFQLNLCLQVVGQSFHIVVHSILKLRMKKWGMVWVVNVSRKCDKVRGRWHLHLLLHLVILKVVAEGRLWGRRARWNNRPALLFNFDRLGLFIVGQLVSSQQTSVYVERLSFFAIKSLRVVWLQRLLFAQTLLPYRACKPLLWSGFMVEGGILGVASSRRALHHRVKRCTNCASLSLKVIPAVPRISLKLITHSLAVAA